MSAKGNQQLVFWWTYLLKIIIVCTYCVINASISTPGIARHSVEFKISKVKFPIKVDRFRQRQQHNCNNHNTLPQVSQHLAKLAWGTVEYIWSQIQPSVSGSVCLPVKFSCCPLCTKLSVIRPKMTIMRGSAIPCNAAHTRPMIIRMISRGVA